MSVPGLYAGGGGSSGYQISRSLRLRASASASLSRTFTGSSGNRRLLTYSAWVKRGNLTTQQTLLGTSEKGASFGYGVTLLTFNAAGALRFIHTRPDTGGSNIECESASLFRDPLAWYHVVLCADTAQASGTNGVKMYVNGVQQALNFAAYTQNSDLFWTDGDPSTNKYIGRWSGISPTNYLDGHLAEITLVDGQALTPSSFGESDASGNWRPKKYTGTYGINGFLLDFSDPTSLTTLMADSSGNGNNWTANNISLTAGATYDSMLDVPLGGGGNERGNYATLNPLNPSRSTISNANLTASGSTDLPTISPDSGTWYFERGGAAQTWTPPAAFPAGSGDYNFGQRPWQSTGPTAGQKALHTGNLTSDTVTASGSFTGNVSADGPFVWMNGAPETLTINGNAVTWGTHADKTAGGFKLRTSSASYNSSGTNTWTATVLTPASKSAFKYQNAKGNP